MSPAAGSLTAIVAASLTEDERAGAVAYAARDPLAAGAHLDLAGTVVETFEAAWLVFIDRDPTANWGHPARYLLVDRATGKVRSIETRLPPPADLKWRTLYQALSVPDAAVAFPQ